MLMQVLKLARYYIQVATSKPLFFILPLLLTLGGGSYFILNMKPNYYSEAFLLLEFEHIPSTLISPTVSNERLQFIEERVFTRNKLISLAEDFGLFRGVSDSLSRTQLATMVRNKIVLRTAMTEGTEGYASTASVRIGFNDGDARVAAAVTSRLVEMIMAENKRIRTSRATEATNFFIHEVNNITAHLRAREAEWAGYREVNRHIQPSRIPALLIELQAKEEELAALNQARLVLDEEVKLMEGQLRLRSGENSDASAIRSQIASLRSEISERSLVYSDNHPRIQILKQRLDALTATAAEAEGSKAQARVLSPELALLAERIANAKPRQEASRLLSSQLGTRIDWLKAVIARAPEVEARLEAIETERQNIQRSLTDMQGKLDTARLGERLEQGSSLSRIEVVESPEIAPYRSGPGRKTLLIVLAGLSLLAGAAGIYVADSLDPTIRGSFDLADALEGQELIMIPNWTPAMNRRRFWWWQNRGSMAPGPA